MGESIILLKTSAGKTPTENRRPPTAEIWADAMVEISNFFESEAFIELSLHEPEELVLDLLTQGRGK